MSAHLITFRDDSVKLAIVHPFLHTHGGAEKVVLKIAEEFDAKIYCSDYAPEKTYDGFRKLDVEVLPKGSRQYLPPLIPKRARDAANAGQQFWNLKLGDYDVVNAQGTPSEWVRHHNSPVVFYCHSPNREAFVLYEWRQSRRNPLERALYWSFVQAYKHFEFQTVPKIEHIFANSRTTQERVMKYLNRESEVLHPGVDYKEFRCADYEPYFFYPSRIVPEKRFEFAIDAFEKFRQRVGPKKRWKLVLAGALHAGNAHHVDYCEKLKQRISNMPDVELKLNLSVHEIHELYANCYSVVYTPVHEDFGLVPLEGFASSKPVIAWNEGGPREIVQDGKNGYLVNSVDELAQRMAYLAERPKLAEQMGRLGRKRVEKEFSWKHFLRRVGEACGKVAKEAK